MKSSIYLITVLAASLSTGNVSQAQDYSRNIFEGQNDVGACKIMGDLHFMPGNQEYTITGSGDNIWFGEDQFHYAWKKLSGDFILSANISFLGEGSHEHRKAGWMIRRSLETGSPHVSGTVHGDGLTSLQYRTAEGAETSELISLVTSPDVIQLERRGDKFIFSSAVAGNPLDSVMISDSALAGDVYAGLFICSHDNGVSESAVFTNVRIIRPAKDDFVPYRDYLGSTLEIMDVETGLRKVIYQAPNSIQAPNWTPDGKYLIYNSEGLLYRFDLAAGKPEVINSDFARSNNNDHVLSFDGKMLGISHHVAEEDNKSILFILPVGGGMPERITAEGPSYLHGWSPDGRYLTYTAERGGEYDIYKIDIKKKKEIRLTSAPGLDDGSEYSPDGRYIYFNSARTGTMQLWRMKPDGSEQEQLTFDMFNDWFPHISPDGKHIVFLSFLPDVRADDHPFYKHVYIRMMAADGGTPADGVTPADSGTQADEGTPAVGGFPADRVTPKVVAYFYGGQGSINVPSWSPDSKQIAFVSNTGTLEP